MALTTIDNLLPLVQPELPGIADTFLKQQVRRAVRDFLTRCALWRVVVKVNAVDEQQEYTIDLSGTSNNIFPQDVLRLYDNDDDKEIPSDNYTFKNGTLILDDSIIPTEDKTDKWDVTAHATPDFSCTDFPEEILNYYGDAIAGRVFELLCAQEGRKWFNIQLARRGARDFRRGIKNARIRVNPELKITG